MGERSIFYTTFLNNLFLLYFFFSSLFAKSFLQRFRKNGFRGLERNSGVYWGTRSGEGTRVGIIEGNQPFVLLLTRS